MNRFWWAVKDSNLGPSGLVVNISLALTSSNRCFTIKLIYHEPGALTNWANGPYGQPVFSWVGKHSDRILFLSTPGSNSDINTFYCVLAPPEWFEHSTPWSVATCSSAELRGHIWWAIKGSNLGPTGYEPVALTNWANGPYNTEYWRLLHLYFGISTANQKLCMHNLI